MKKVGEVLVKKKIKMDQKNIILIVLLVVVVALAGFTYYLYSGVTECKTVAEGLGAQLIECGAGLTQLQAGLAECMVGATACQEVLTGLKQIPDCAPYIPEGL